MKKSKPFSEYSRPQITRLVRGAMKQRYSSIPWMCFEELVPGTTHKYSKHHTPYQVDLAFALMSISKFKTVGIEIKSCRADFTADKKWQNYIEHFDEFYFACPAGVISEDEILYDDVGLYYVYESGRVVQKVRATPTKPQGHEHACPALLLQMLMKCYKKGY